MAESAEKFKIFKIRFVYRKCLNSLRTLRSAVKFSYAQIRFAEYDKMINRFTVEFAKEDCVQDDSIVWKK